MDPEFTRLIATGGHYPPVTGAAHDKRFALEPGVLQAFHGHEKSIQVKMGDMAVLL
jgi:hypothetical protein